MLFTRTSLGLFVLFYCSNVESIDPQIVRIRHTIPTLQFVRDEASTNYRPFVVANVWIVREKVAGKWTASLLIAHE